MPTLKQQEEPFAKTVRLLKGYDMTPNKLAEVLGCHYNTAKRRLECPMDLTLGELEKICKKGHIPADEIRDSLVF